MILVALGVGGRWPRTLQAREEGRRVPGPLRHEPGVRGVEPFGGEEDTRVAHAFWAVGVEGLEEADSGRRGVPPVVVEGVTAPAGASAD